MSHNMLYAGLLVLSALAATLATQPGHSSDGCRSSMCGVLRYETITVTKTLTKAAIVPTCGMEVAYLLSRIPAAVARGAEGCRARAQPRHPGGG